MKNWRHILVGLTIAFTVTASPSLASDSPPRILNIFDNSLVLNGFGERELWWTEIYRCALYLSKRSTAVGYIRDPKTAKAIRIRILYDDIPHKMPADWREIFVEELNRELLGRLKRAYRNLEVNDVLTFSYKPGKGSEIWVNSERLLTDPGHELMLELVDQWLGDRPVSKNLKWLLLNKST